jgi:hypothetical protein
VAPSILKKLAMIAPITGGRSVGIVRSRTQTMEFSLDFRHISQPEVSRTTLQHSIHNGGQTLVYDTEHVKHLTCDQEVLVRILAGTLTILAEGFQHATNP